MIGSSDNSGGVVDGTHVCRTECAWFKSRLKLDFFSYFCEFRDLTSDHENLVLLWA